MGHSEDEKEKRLSRKKPSDGVCQIFIFCCVILGVSIVFYKRADCLGIFKK